MAKTLIAVRIFAPAFDEVTAWCYDNFYTEGSYNVSFPRIIFYNEQDYVLFALRFSHVVREAATYS